MTIPDAILTRAWESLTVVREGRYWSVRENDAEVAVCTSEIGAEATRREAAVVEAGRLLRLRVQQQDDAGYILAVLDDIDLMRHKAHRPWADVAREALGHAAAGTMPPGFDDDAPL